MPSGENCKQTVTAELDEKAARQLAWERRPAEANPKQPGQSRKASWRRHHSTEF